MYILIWKRNILKGLNRSEAMDWTAYLQANGIRYILKRVK